MTRSKLTKAMALNVKAYYNILKFLGIISRRVEVASPLKKKNTFPGIIKKTRQGRGN